MKATEESADAHNDFDGDESTLVMEANLLSSLTERSRRIDVAAPPASEEERSMVDEPEPVTVMRPAARPQPLVADGEYPALGDEEPTVMMEEPEPTTVAVRSQLDRSPPPPPKKLPAPALAAEPLPAQSVPDPQWAADLAPDALAKMWDAPLAAAELGTTPESTSKPAAGSRRLGALAAVALGVAAWTLGLGHHELLPPSAIASPAPSVSSVVVTPWGLQAQAETTVDNVRTALGSLLQWSTSVASAQRARASGTRAARPGRASAPAQLTAELQ
jgi:hypothetical protein